MIYEDNVICIAQIKELRRTLQLQLGKGVIVSVIRDQALGRVDQL